MADAKAVNTDLDKGIAQNLDAALIEAKLHDNVKYAVKNHVVTLTGDVTSNEDRREAEQVCDSVPQCSAGGKRVASENEEKATSSN